jgi:hypothetical protein
MNTDLLDFESYLIDSVRDAAVADLIEQIEESPEQHDWLYKVLIPSRGSNSVWNETYSYALNLLCREGSEPIIDRPVNLVKGKAGAKLMNLL